MRSRTRMSRSISGSGSGSGSSNGGIAGSGIFGMFGTTIRCNSDDESMYCFIMKIFNVMIVLGLISYMLYLAYHFIGPSTFKLKTR